MNSKIKWGILGTGNIANRFATHLADLEEAQLAAVGSRSPETARAFGEKYGVPAERCFGSYAELVGSPEVDVVYIASPHGLHREHALLALHAGKHILAEKSFALSESEAAEVFAEAERRGLYACEAMWSRFLPTNIELMRRLRAGELGAVKSVSAAFGAHFSDEWDAGHRIYAPALGGGALLDMGVYPASFVSMIFGDAQPDSALTSGCLFPFTGVDEQSVTVLNYGGALGTFSCAIKAELKDDGFISCEEGTVYVPSFWNAQSFTLRKRGCRPEEVSLPQELGGLAYEARAVCADIRAGRGESAVMPHAATLTVLKTLDAARHALGFYYEKGGRRL